MKKGVYGPLFYFSLKTEVIMTKAMMGYYPDSEL